MAGKLTLAEAQRRIAEAWHPYHDRLLALLAEARAEASAWRSSSTATRCRTTR